jgi:SAM-dependent methyltransferase
MGAAAGGGPAYGNWQKYNSASRLQRLLVARFLETVRRTVELTGAASIADVGCAEGFVAAFLRRSFPVLSCSGIDVDLEALRRGKQLNPGFDSQQADIHHLPYRSKSVDLVLCLEVLEHLREPGVALAKITRVARRYGLLSVPHEPFFRLANLARGKSILRLGDDIDHRQHWTRGGFGGFVSANGLRVRALRAPMPWLVALAEVQT